MSGTNKMLLVIASKSTSNLNFSMTWNLSSKIRSDGDMSLCQEFNGEIEFCLYLEGILLPPKVLNQIPHNAHSYYYTRRKWLGTFQCKVCAYGAHDCKILTKSIVTFLCKKQLVTVPRLTLFQQNFLERWDPNSSVLEFLLNNTQTLCSWLTDSFLCVSCCPRILVIVPIFSLNFWRLLIEVISWLKYPLLLTLEASYSSVWL